MGNDCEEDDEDDRPDEAPDCRDVHSVSLSLDEILSILAHRRRRDLVRYFVENSTPTVSVAECVEYLAEQEGQQADDPHDYIRKRLHHVHVPKLADAGVIEYDARSKEIRYWGQDELERWLERIDAVESEAD